MDESVISEVTFFPIRPTTRGLIGFSSCLFDGKLALNCISVYTTPVGDIRLLFPNKILPNGKELNVYYPVHRQTYDAIKKAVEDKYKEITAGVSY